MDIDPKQYCRSHELKARADEVIPTGTQTFSKAARSHVGNISPLYIDHGDGAHVCDVDGNEFIDYILGLGPVTVGYADERVNAAVTEQLERGTLFPLPGEAEIELAERLCELIPAAEMVRFGKNGSDATSAAVRLARAYTGRERIAYCGYHGWQDWYAASTIRDRGIPDCIKPLSMGFQYNDLENLVALFEEHGDEIAAVIMEPVSEELPEDNFLAAVRDVAHDNGALLIFDEIITGFRVSMGGAQEHFGVTPDLAAFGKGMANGFPLSALVGREDVMRELEEVFFSFTFGGELASIAATQRTIDILQEEQVIDHMWTLGERVREETNDLIATHGLEDYIACRGLAPWPVLEFEGDTDDDLDLLAKSLFQQEVVNRGVLFNGNHFFCEAHTAADIDRTMAVYDEAFETLSTALADDAVEAHLEGDRIRPIFRRENATNEESM
jgi:glutamate-1-semialdehyde 2,1-aminomutase/spore coat polysaccharide biosynthesis protein SpsF